MHAHRRKPKSNTLHIILFYKAIINRKRISNSFEQIKVEFNL
jgi:hypothetical protein